MPYSIGNLLKAVRIGFGNNRKYYRMRDVISLAETPKDAVILRFDVERALEHQLKVARQLANTNIQCTMYFHTRIECYEPQKLRKVQDLGHEVGYHHECLDRCGGDFKQARELFLRELELFRKDHLDLFTVCSHGEAGLRERGYRANYDLFERYPNLLTEAGVRGEVYHWLRDKSPLYASDTFRSYSKFWSTLYLAPTIPKPLMILAHLHRWHTNPAITSLEVTRDILRQLTNRICHKRKYNLALQ